METQQYCVLEKRMRICEINMQRNPLLLHQPGAPVSSRSVFDPIDHRPGGIDFCHLAGGGCFDIEDRAR